MRTTGTSLRLAVAMVLVVVLYGARGIKGNWDWTARVYLAAYGHFQYSIVSASAHSSQPEHLTMSTVALVYEKGKYVGHLERWGDFVAAGLTLEENATRHCFRNTIAGSVIYLLPPALCVVTLFILATCLRATKKVTAQSP